MAVVELTKEQVFDLVRQMPSDQKREMLLLLAGNGSARAKRQELAEQQLRRLCAERGLDWDKMSPDQREDLIDGLMHEDRPCPP